MTLSSDVPVSPQQRIQEYRTRYHAAKLELKQAPTPERRSALLLEVAHCTEQLRKLAVYSINLRLSNAGEGKPRFADLETEVDSDGN